jgi:hypothetical protein
MYVLDGKDLGGVFIPSSMQFRASEVAHRPRDSGAVAAIPTSGLLDMVDEPTANCRELKRIIGVPYQELTPPGDTLIEYGKAVKEGSEAFTTAANRSVGIAFIAYTSDRSTSVCATEARKNPSVCRTDGHTPRLRGPRVESRGLPRVAVRGYHKPFSDSPRQVGRSAVRIGHLTSFAPIVLLK